MADITVDIVIPDANVAEVSQALNVSTKAEFQDWVRTQVKQQVKVYRQRQVEEVEQVKVRTAEEAKETAIDTAVNAVDTDIVLG